MDQVAEARHPIAVCRERLGKTQEEFGAMLGVDAMTVSRWERGENLPSRRYWPKLEELTELPIVVVLAGAKPTAGAAA
jgi:transcriptional regulator with XRE-family HTH domain